MGLKTPLYDSARAQGGKFIDFGGWDLPVSFGSQLEEHHAVRREAGVFDVSHMGIVDIEGDRSQALLRELLANDVSKLTVPGRALYSCMLRPTGGIMDDLIVYLRGAGAYRLVVNAGTRAKDLAWITEHAARAGVQVRERTDLAMLAIQGPKARARAMPLLPEMLREPAARLQRFSAAEAGDWFVARTGYTGEDGFEVMLPADDAVSLWRALSAKEVRPIGLGARDTLRLEAGMNLYGNDMDESRHPLESGLEWTVAFEPRDRNFIGRAALEALRARADHALFVGLLLEERGVLRSHQRIDAPLPGSGDAPPPASRDAPPLAARDAPGALGEVTSGTFSPTLNRSIGLARVARGAGPQVLVDIRGKAHAARIVKPPFVREGRILIDL
jgi:aminomethyltransferase